MSYKPQAIIFLKKALGEEGLEELNKFELYKKKTNTVVDPEEIKLALQIVPRTILSFLKKELGVMKENEGKRIKIPVELEAYLDVTKFTNDVYSGEIHEEGKVTGTFKYRSLPGVGLVIMSAFELYDISDLNHIGKKSYSESESSDIQQVQKIIDDKLNFRDLVSKVVDQRISERQAIDEMVRARLTQMMLESKEENKEVLKVVMEKKPLKLKEFLDKKALKKNEPSYDIKIEKSELVTCPDCGNKIFDKSGFSGCICFGLDRDKKIHIRKNENGVELSFSKSWDQENIEMLVETLRERANRSKNE